MIIYRATNVSANIDAVMCFNHTMVNSNLGCTQRLNMETIPGTHVILVPIGMAVSSAAACNVTGEAQQCYTKDMTTVATMVTQGSGAHISSEVSLAVLLPCLFVGLLKKMM